MLDEAEREPEWAVTLTGNQDSVAKTQTPALVLVTEDVDATCTELQSRGVAIKRGPEDAPWEPGTRWAMIDDSEGNLVLIQTAP